MLLIKLWNYIRGYVIIKITGEYSERLLNQAALENLYFWDVQRIDSKTLIARICIGDFFKLSCFARKTRCRIFIIERVGLFFIVHKIRKRKVFLIGFLLFIIAVYLLSSFIWFIEVHSPDRVLSSKIGADLRGWGLKEGTFKYRINKRYYLDRILDKYKDIAWVEIEIKGSRVIVELVKKQLPPELEENTPCDIIASKDGMIEEIIPLRGEALVKPGDTVSAGDLLISGKIVFDEETVSEGKNADKRELNVHAKGIVKARVWYQKAIKVPLVKEEEVLTGRIKKSYSIQMGKHIFNIQWGNIPFDMYNRKIVRESNIFPFMADFSFSQIHFQEIKKNKQFLGVEEAAREAERQLLLELDSSIKNETMTQKKMEFSLDSDENSVIGTLTVEVIEDIGQKRKTY